MSAALASPPRRAQRTSVEQSLRQQWAYLVPDGPLRELVTLDGHAGSTLLVDQIALSGADRRLVAHLPADEPPANVALTCRLYLADRLRRGHCRKLRAGDLAADPLPPAAADPQAIERELTDTEGHLLRLRRVDGPSWPLRWTRSLAPHRQQPYEVVPLRRAIGCMQTYEPILTLTAQAAAATPGLASGRLRTELAQLRASAIVLNTQLRAAVLAATAGGQATLSQIAIACGHTKLAPDGHRVGETTWLKRRIGIRGDGTGAPPTPWIDQRVLELIAIRGLGLAPIEVEAPRDM